VDNAAVILPMPDTGRTAALTILGTMTQPQTPKVGAEGLWITGAERTARKTTGESGKETSMRSLRATVPRHERPAAIWDRFHVGMRATVAVCQEAYYSGYAGNPVCILDPGMTGVIAEVDVPYVRRPRGCSESFACVDFEHPLHPGRIWRTGVDPKHLVPLGTLQPHPPDTVLVIIAEGSRLQAYTAVDAAVLDRLADTLRGSVGGDRERVRATLAAHGLRLEEVAVAAPEQLPLL
jgi:hypothetical protein